VDTPAAEAVVVIAENSVLETDVAMGQFDEMPHEDTDCHSVHVEQHAGDTTFKQHHNSFGLNYKAK